ncbi:phosphogluconate dehydratase [Kineosporia sp. NBRC 101731]|uniref:phosphogluconate dehydratase n=1 Tax=Kineosporia sp. NBRC 101731 TaxID=3032199 RepID=UPI0024A4C9E5|nr:phosphogluconate dehydratase [Kineosporia sp. NBRC 101731]GLY31318.1 phosphogluconate dehydratase [Kineosporia sp. NBRC 101731]
MNGPIGPISAIQEITARIARRSELTRTAYLERVSEAIAAGPARGRLGCSNLAHGFAAGDAQEKTALRGTTKPNIAIVSAYNDLLSAHRPFENYPARIKKSVIRAGGIAQFAGGVPAMCDGITQGRDGMQLSLFSRDVIAMSTAVALSHEMFDGAIMLGVCDKIVPGLLIGALAFGHLPTVLIPAGPMTSGIPNGEKARIRKQFEQGLVDRQTLLEAEAASYHGPGTCTFYGTANSNQLLMEVMGLHLPGASLPNPGTELRDALTDAAAARVTGVTPQGSEYTPIAHVIDEKAVVNGVVGLLATGGSTNHTIHLVAIARAAGITLTWDDISDLGRLVPLLSRIYPNGSADVNHFHAAGGIGLLIRELLDAGLLHDDVQTIAGPGLRRYTEEPVVVDGSLAWRPGPTRTLDADVLRPVSDPFSPEGGIRIVHGNLGQAVVKVSAVAPEHLVITAPARVFDTDADFLTTFRAGDLDGDAVVVIRHQGPAANGMPELHGLTSALGIMQDRGQRVALVTDGRMSGASGAIPAAIHVTPEAAAGGPIARIQDGDVITLDCLTSTLQVDVEPAVLAARPIVTRTAAPAFGAGRELFAAFRSTVGPADQGATVFGDTLGMLGSASNGASTHHSGIETGISLDLGTSERRYA